MITRPKFKPKYHVVDLGAEGVFLLSENEKHVLEGETLRRLVHHIDGVKTWPQIFAALQPTIAEQDIQVAANVLLQNGHLVEQDTTLPDAFQVYWGELGRSPQQAIQLVANTNVHVKFVGNVDPQVFVSALQSFGYKTNPEAPASLFLVVTDDYQYPALAEINRFCHSQGMPWLLVQPSGLRPLIGPFFVPGRTACWQCLDTRLRHNREVESFIQRKINRDEPFPVVKARIPLLEQQVAAQTVIQMTRWLSQGLHPELESRIVSLDALTMQQQFHFVTRRPQCACCGNPALDQVAGRPVYLSSKTGHNDTGNGTRLEAPEVTYARYAHHVSDLSGIVKAVEPSHWNHLGPIRVYTAGHNFALKNDELFFLKDGLRTHSSGKGKSDAQARTSALCEALERYAGLYRDSETKIRASFKNLGGQAVDPRSVLMFSEKQYEERLRWLQMGSRFQVVPMPFDENAEIDWTPVWSWTQQRVKYLPTSYLFYGYVDGDDRFFCWGDSNGNAAGSNLEDAILQGFLELIERDSVCLWWYNRLKRPQVDLETLEDPYVAELQQFYHGVNREFWVLDLTADTGIPAFAAINRRTNHAREDIIMGFGAHLDARVAINRAITEMNQFIPAVLHQNAEGNTVYGYGDPDAIRWWENATIANQPYLVPAEGEKLALKNLPVSPSADLKEQVEYCFRLVEAMGHEVLIMDQTRPDVGLPVAKVIVPGLRHFWARFGPGRLYDIPVKMGWLERPLTEEELNPIPMFV